MRTGICTRCRDHADFIKLDNQGEELKPSDKGYAEAEFVSNCCTHPEVEV